MNRLTLIFRMFFCFHFITSLFFHSLLWFFLYIVLLCYAYLSNSNISPTLYKQHIVTIFVIWSKCKNIRCVYDVRKYSQQSATLSLRTVFLNGTCWRFTRNYYRGGFCCIAVIIIDVISSTLLIFYLCLPSSYWTCSDELDTYIFSFV